MGPDLTLPAGHPMSSAGTGLPAFEGGAFFTQSGAAAAATKNIWVAAADGEVDTVRAHLDAGVDPNARDDNGYTALHAAASYSHVPVLEMLVSRGGAPAPRAARTPLLRPIHGSRLAKTFFQRPFPSSMRTETRPCTRRRAATSSAG